MVFGIMLAVLYNNVIDNITDSDETALLAY